LHIYSRVISDCEWAHKLNENSLKAWLYKARAYHEMGDEKMAADCLKEAETHNPDSKAQIQGKLVMRTSARISLQLLPLHAMHKIYSLLPPKYNSRRHF
jgi:tetratricopeptide (TPR) repeat protein